MRFWLVRVALLGVLLLVAAGCDWTMFGYGPAHTRYNSTEKTIGVGNVAGLKTAWQSDPFSAVSSPAVANGIAYVGSNAGLLYAFDATGSTGCDGTPKKCAPLWTASIGGSLGTTNKFSSPAVVNGVVYIGGDDGKLYAFDAAGSTGCAGTPKTCAPLWTAATGSRIFSSPVVVNGVVYIGGGDGKLDAFDATGSTGCSGTPKTCGPLWSATVGGQVYSSPAVLNGVVYIGSFTGRLYAFDATGMTGCAGTPKTCAPLWTSSATAWTVESSPAVADGVVYVGGGDGKLYAFDATGSTGCSGTPKTCAPLWTASTNGAIIYSSPAVANGVVYVAAYTAGKLFAFDATGSTGCSGTPKTCAPLWTAANSSTYSSPAVANGVVYVGSVDHRLSAFDAAGSSGCSGTPKTCVPLWTSFTTPGPVQSSPVVANGVVYVSQGGLYAFTP